VDRGVVQTSIGEAGRSWCLVGAGGGPPPHRHLAEDELFTITEGSIAFTTGEAPRSASAGESGSTSSARLNAAHTAPDLRATRSG
jgi:hypothetical protein